VFAKKVLYHLSHTSIHFALVILNMGSGELFAQAGLELDLPDISLPSS
jgi:hypothetical protein